MDVSGIEGETLGEIRSAVREQVSEALDEAPELLGEPPVAGALSPGVRDRRRRERPKDPDSWLRKGGTADVVMISRDHDDAPSPTSGRPL